MGIVLGIVVAILFITILVGIWSQEEDNAKSEVKRFLEGEGFRDIKVTIKLVKGSKNSVVFDVEYRDKNGTLQTNSCLAQRSMFSNPKFYWDKPLE